MLRRVLECAAETFRPAHAMNGMPGPGMVPPSAEQLQKLSLLMDELIAADFGPALGRRAEHSAALARERDAESSMHSGFEALGMEEGMDDGGARGEKTSVEPNGHYDGQYGGGGGGGYSSCVSYQHVVECTEFSVGVFFMPRATVIPWHDHPHMTVLSKVLFGKMRVRACDMLGDEPAKEGVSARPSLAAEPGASGAGMEVSASSSSGEEEGSAPDACSTPRRGIGRFDAVVTDRSPTQILTQSYANIHAFEAIEDCAVFDILAPPYDEYGERPCTYYSVRAGALEGGAEEGEGQGLGAAGSALHVSLPGRLEGGSSEAAWECREGCALVVVPLLGEHEPDFEVLTEKSTFEF